MFDLNGKKALVTGATGGLGQAMARALHANGAQVTLTGTRKEVLEDLAASLGDGAHAITANLGDAAGIAELAGAAQEAMEGLDILVNNAGIARDNIAVRMKDEDWDAVMKLNLDATFRLARAVLRPMMKGRWGRIINITSVVGTTGNAGQTTGGTLDHPAMLEGWAPRKLLRPASVIWPARRPLTSPARPCILTAGWP